MIPIDLRSDTVTHPTPKMRELMFQAEVGDDVYRDDPTVLALENLAARVSGKEAAMFVSSGTMGNQLAIMTHTQRGDEIIVHEQAHVVFHEAGAIALLSQVNTAQVQNASGFVFASDIKEKARGNNIHYPRTSLVCIENAVGNGKVIDVNTMKETYDCAKKYKLSVHLDGARIFNAVAALNVDVKELAQYCDSMMFCLSKGLCAPVGSMLVGSKSFIDEARRNRKKIGGGMRQAGILAAAGVEAIEVMSKRLKEDHDHAKYLAALLMRNEIYEVNQERLDINMVYFKINISYVEEDFISYMSGKNIRINGSENGELRFVTHYWISKTDIDYVVHCMNMYFER